MKTSLLLLSWAFIFLNIATAQDSITGYWKKSECYINEQKETNSNLFMSDRLVISISDTNDLYIFKGYKDADAYYGIYSLSNNLFFPHRIVNADRMSIQKPTGTYINFINLVQEMFYYELHVDTLWLKNHKIKMSFLRASSSDINISKINSKTIQDIDKRESQNRETQLYIARRLRTAYIEYIVTELSSGKFMVEEEIYSYKGFLRWVKKELQRQNKERPNTSLRLVFKSEPADNRFERWEKLHNDLMQIDEMIDLSYSLFNNGH